MYSWGQILRGLKFPGLISQEILTQVSPISNKLLGRDDLFVTERDWDNLIILDACRYDIFKKYNILSGELNSAWSKASNTAEFVRKTFLNKKFPDIVCVTSTPKYYKPNVEDSFYDIIHVWKDDWDPEYRTVLPDVMSKYVLDAQNKYPNKRILAHYIPPHQPFIGETGLNMPHMVQFSGDTIQMDIDQPKIWEAIRTGLYNADDVWKAYTENLEIILPEIQNILDELNGKTVVTSDHGNVFGRLPEFGIIGHPPYCHIKPLIKVPWLTFDSGRRKKIKKGQLGNNKKSISASKVEGRLSDLGYM